LEGQTISIDKKPMWIVATPDPEPPAKPVPLPPAPPKSAKEDPEELSKRNTARQFFTEPPMIGTIKATDKPKPIKEMSIKVKLEEP
jgi:hypothetical protein